MNGYCECGCGERTSLVTHADHRRGAVRGKFRRFVHGHNNITPIEYRFWRKVEPLTTGCWKWLGTTTSGGYPRLAGVNTAYQWAYESYVGPVPDGQELHHLCRNRWCVNPGHLRPMTRKDHVHVHLYGEAIS